MSKTETTNRIWYSRDEIEFLILKDQGVQLRDDIEFEWHDNHEAVAIIPCAKVTHG